MYGQIAGQLARLVENGLPWAVIIGTAGRHGSRRGKDRVCRGRGLRNRSGFGPGVRPGGAKVVAVDVVVDGGEDTVALIEADAGDAVFVQCDVSSATEVEAAVKTAVDTYGRLDCAHSNVGIEGVMCRVIVHRGPSFGRGLLAYAVTKTATDFRLCCPTRGSADTSEEQDLVTRKGDEAVKEAIVALKSQRDFTDPDARVLKTADGWDEVFTVTGLENTVNVFRTFRNAVD